MKILVNLASLISPVTGIGQYTQNILDRLLESSSVDEIVGLSPFGTFNREELMKFSLEHRECQSKYAPEQISRVRVLVKHIPGTRKIWRWLKSAHASHANRHLKGFVYWESNYLLLPFDGPSVLTIHDVSHIKLPHFHPESRVVELNTQLPKSIQKATRLAAVSEFTAQEVDALFKSNKPIDIISPGVDKGFFVDDQNKVHDCRVRYKLPEKFILSVGTLEPRKNLLGVLDAFEKLPISLQGKFPLVIIGVKGWKDESLLKRINGLKTTGRVNVLGYVDQSDLPLIYAAATISVYVSHYEGFGMPIIESMAAGTPVLTANVASMPEVAGGAALLANPKDVSEISYQLNRLLTDELLVKSLTSLGLERALNYTWDSSAQNLLSSLQKAKENL